MFSAQNRMNKIYRAPMDSIYKHRFFEDLCSGYALVLGERSDRRNFFTFEPEDCKISKLIKGNDYYDLSYNLENIIHRIIYSLMVFGKAYVYISPEYTTILDDENKETTVLTSVKIDEIKGYIKKHNKTNITFSYKKYDGTISDIDMQRNQLIEFDIKELGFRKRYFVNIAKKLGKCDITLLSTIMVEKNVEGYDFSVHAKKNKIQELRAAKDIGWLFGTDGLSDSYILYKKIQEDKLRINFLNYILEKLNCGFESFMDDTGGNLIAHIKKKNYDQLWKDYLEGKITGTELTNVLYHYV